MDPTYNANYVPVISDQTEHSTPCFVSNLLGRTHCCSSTRCNRGAECKNHPGYPCVLGTARNGVRGCLPGLTGEGTQPSQIRRDYPFGNQFKVVGPECLAHSSTQRVMLSDAFQVVLDCCGTLQVASRQTNPNQFFPFPWHSNSVKTESTLGRYGRKEHGP